MLDHNNALRGRPASFTDRSGANSSNLLIPMEKLYILLLFCNKSYVHAFYFKTLLRNKLFLYFKFLNYPLSNEKNE